MLRIRIYSLAGLERFCPINLAQESHRSHVIQSTTSRTSQDEISQHCREKDVYCFYRQRIRGFGNRGIRGNDFGLECFCDILPRQILYICKQVYAEAQRVLYGRNKFVLPSTYLGLLSKLSTGALTSLKAVDVVVTTPLYKSNIEAFLQSIRQLVLMVNLSTFSFGISCKIDGVTGGILLDGLKVLQGIKELSLRLNDFPDPSLISVVKSTALTLTGRSHIPPKPFRFTELPVELRHLVICHTDLVPFYNSHQSYPSCIWINDGKIDQDYGICCRTCTNSLTECACWSRARAYSTQCTCRSHTFGLFRVSRSLNADAAYVCFSKNRFVLRCDSSFASHTAFLLSLPSHALYSIRQLDIQVSDVQIGCFEPDRSQSAIINEVSKLLGVISTTFNLPLLHLSLDFFGLSIDDFSDDDDDDLDWVYELHREISRVIALKFKGRGLDRFEVFSNFWCEEEDELEKMVMGDGYDALARGKVHWEDRSPSDPHRKFNKAKGC